MKTLKLQNTTLNVTLIQIPFNSLSSDYARLKISYYNVEEIKRTLSTTFQYLVK